MLASGRMDTRYMKHLTTLIKGANRELNRAQEMNEPPSVEFMDLLTNTEEEWVEAGRRFRQKEMTRE